MDAKSADTKNQKAPSRLGPRPLPLHLMSASALLSSSRLALPFLKGGWLPWKPELVQPVQALQRDLDGVGAGEFALAVEGELARRSALFLQGIERYRAHAYTRTLQDPPVLWQEGTTRLLDYAPSGGRPVLVVPSLINRGYILDLKQDSSLLRYLAQAEIRPLLLDWGQPGDVERRFDLTDYIAGRLDRAFDAAFRIASAPLAVMGYCMGGLMALALAERRQRDISRLILLATPWDFHAGPNAEVSLFKALSLLLDNFPPIEELPTDALQSLFFLADPQLAMRKFSRFAELDPASPEAVRFVAIEDWLNDGVPLALPTARDCIQSWYAQNQPLCGKWKIGGRPVDPSKLDRPALVVVSSTDRLVRAASARPLAAALPQAELLEVPLGHVGLITAMRAPPLVWARLLNYLQS